MPISEELLKMIHCSAYIALPLFCLFFIGWKYYDGCCTVPLESVDLLLGRREIDYEEEQYIEEQNLGGPKSRLRRIWDAL